jgi:hypothetical protein
VFLYELQDICTRGKNNADQVKYTVKKAWKALHFTMRIHKNGKCYSSACTSLVRPILEYRVACWDPYREGQTGALGWVENKTAKFATSQQ